MASQTTKRPPDASESLSLPLEWGRPRAGREREKGVWTLSRTSLRALFGYATHALEPDAPTKGPFKMFKVFKSFKMFKMFKTFKLLNRFA